MQVFEEPHLDSVGEAAERFRPRTEARRPPGFGFADRDDSALVTQESGEVGCDDGRALVAERASEDAAEVLLARDACLGMRVRDELGNGAERRQRVGPHPAAANVRAVTHGRSR